MFDAFIAAVFNAWPLILTVLVVWGVSEWLVSRRLKKLAGDERAFFDQTAQEMSLANQDAGNTVRELEIAQKEAEKRAKYEISLIESLLQSNRDVVAELRETKQVLREKN